MYGDTDVRTYVYRVTYLSGKREDSSQRYYRSAVPEGIILANTFVKF